MKRKEISIDKDEIFESLRNVGITIENSSICTDGLAIINETGEIQILPKDFNFFQSDLYYDNSDSQIEEEQQCISVKTIICTYNTWNNDESKNDIKTFNVMKLSKMVTIDSENCPEFIAA